MGMTAAMKALRVVGYAETVLGIETLCAAQGLDLRAPLKPGKALVSVHRTFRSRVPYLPDDTVLAPLIEEARKWVLERAWRTGLEPN